MKIIPILLASVPVGAGSDPASYGAANPTKVLLARDSAPGDSVQVELRVQNAVVSVRPYYWRPVAGIAGGGAWVGIGTDGATGVGTQPTTADPSLFNACANGRYQDYASGAKSWLLVVEAGAVADVLWATVEAVCRSIAVSP